MELDKICRLCLTIKKDMRNIYSESILKMLQEFISNIKISKEDGWPHQICSQCMHQVSRCHSFKKKIETSDEQLKQYIKSLTVIIEEPVIKEIHQPQMKAQEIQLQRPEQSLQQSAPLIITNLNPTMLNGQQLIQTASGQIIQAQIGQFVPSNNTIQMMTTTSTGQLLQMNDNRLTELIVQPSDRTYHDSYYEDIPIVVQSANGQQTILNIPHHHVHQLQQQMQATATSSSETDDLEIHEVQNYEDDDYACEDLEVIEEDLEQENQNNEATFLVQPFEEEISEIDHEEMIDKQLLSEFLHFHTIQDGSKNICNLCHREFKNKKCLESHMKKMHFNWIKANCKKQPKCLICGKSFRGPGMLKMHFKTHERENKLPTCSVCGKEFKSKSILYRHRATHFAGQKHTCGICKKSFNSQYQLNSHIARHQKNQCSECEKCFNNSNELKSHLQQEHQSDESSKKN